MMVTKRYPHLIFILFIAVGISCLFAICQQRVFSHRCALDGSRINPLHEVVITCKDGSSIRLSCILSAQIWLKENGHKVSCIYVTDEVTGNKLEAEEAHYVLSEAITTPHTGNRIHVFDRKARAKLHAREFNGRLVANPLRVPKRNCTKRLAYRLPLPVVPAGVSPSIQELCLTGVILLTMKQVYDIISDDPIEELAPGYASPPYKPPKARLPFSASIWSLNLKE